MKDYREFTERLIVSKELFYNEKNMYGAYGFKFAETPNYDINVHSIYKNFTIVGDVQRLVEGKEYTVHFIEGFDEKRGVDNYQFIKVESEGLKGREAQSEFLQAILTAKQSAGILKMFPNEEIVEDILNDAVDLTMVKGIGEKAATIIKKKLLKVKVYSEAIITLAPIGASIGAIVSLSEHYGSPEKLLEVVERDIYELVTAHGFGFKKIDEYAQKGGIELDDPRRIKAGSFYVINEMVKNGDTKIDIEKFDEEMCKILDIPEVTDEVFSTILEQDKIYYKNGFISLEHYRQEEEAIVYHLRRIRDNFEPKIDNNDIKEAIEADEERLGFKFNEKQSEAIYNGSLNGVFILDGKAGSGKSASLKTAVNAINLSHVGCALSGKASAVLEQNGLEASTIHRLLGFDPISGGFIHNEELPLQQEVIILDEASMVNNTLFLDLLRAIPNGSQLMIVGDSGQLPAIGHGAVFDFLLQSTEFSHTTLTEVHRQAQDSGTLKVANMVRNGEQYNKYNPQKLEVYGVNKDFYNFSYQDRTQILPELTAVVKRYLDNPNKKAEDLQIITGLKERGELSVLNLNKTLQPLFNPETHSGDEIKGKKFIFRANDRVVQQGNNYKAKVMDRQTFNMMANGLIPMQEAKDSCQLTAIYNGTFGKILEVAQGYGVLIQFESYDGAIFFECSRDENEIERLDLAYAISCHRSQGSGFKTVFLTLTFADYALLSRQFLYTALTRTIDECFMFSENAAVHFAIKTDKGKTRKCFIGDYLK